MSEIDNNVMPLAEDPHNLGEFDNVYQAMRRYPNGGTEDDYIYILGVKHFWNTNRQTWGILKDKEDNLVQMVEDFIMLFYNKGYSFAGIAHPDTVPSEYDGVFYIAAENGTYVNFGNNIKVENEVAIISKARKGDWVKTAVAIPNNERIDGIDSLITTIQETLQAHAQAIVGIEGDIDNLYDSIDETNQDLAELGQTVEEYKELNDKKDEEQDDRIDEVEERLEYIPKESFLSSEPACGYHEEDNVDELTADRAMRDRFGRMIDEEYLTRDAAKNYTQEVVDGSKLEIMPGSVKPEDLSPAVQEMIEAGAGKPGNITNLPDEEDLTVTENNVLKLKDKEYNPYNYSGMGRVYLRKHIVNGTNILAQHMINKPNTIYIIQYDYCLGGETIEIPENCVLQFEGGSLRNGNIKGNYTKITASKKIFYLTLNLIGKFDVETWSAIWYGVSPNNQDNSPNINHYIKQIHNIGGGTILLGKYEYVIKSSIYMAGGVELAGTTFSHGYIDNYNQNLTKLICDFENTNCWAIDSDCFKDEACTERFAKNDNMQVSTPVYGERKGAYSLKNLYIKCNKDKPVYGAIRIIDSTYGTLQDITTWYFKIGIFIGIGWLTTVKKIINNFGYIGIVLQGITTMELNSISNTQRYIAELNDNDIFKVNSSSTSYEDYKYSSIGILAIAAYVNLVNCTAERCDYGAIIDHSVVSFETPYIEAIKKSYFFGVGSNKITVNNMVGYQSEPTQFSEYGIKDFSTSFILNNAHGGNCNIPTDSKNACLYNSKCYIINQFNIDCRPYPYTSLNVWKYSDNPYVYYTNNFEKIFASSTSEFEDRFGTYYLYPISLDTVLERIEKSLVSNYKEVKTIELVEDCSINSLHNLIDKKLIIDGKNHTITINISLWLREATELYIKNCTLNFNNDAQFLMQDSAKLKLENVTINKSDDYDIEYPIVLQRCSGSYVKTKNCIFNGCQAVAFYSSSDINLYFNQTTFNKTVDGKDNILGINSNSRRLYGNAYFEKCTISNESNIIVGVSLIYYGLQEFIIQIDNKTYPYKIDSDNNNYDLLPHNMGTRVFDNDFYQNKFWSGATWVDDRGRVPHRRIGTTEQRPVIQGQLAEGADYFDITIGKPIWFHGNKWVDSSGTEV